MCVPLPAILTQAPPAPTKESYMLIESISCEPVACDFSIPVSDIDIDDRNVLPTVSARVQKLMPLYLKQHRQTD